MEKSAEDSHNGESVKEVERIVGTKKVQRPSLAKKVQGTCRWQLERPEKLKSMHYFEDI